MSYTTSTPAGPPIDEATLSFVRRVAVASEVTPHPSLNEAFHEFSTAFNRWNPKQLLDIKPSDKPVIDFLFSSTITNSTVLKYIAPFRTMIHICVHDWTSQWNQKSLKSDNLLSLNELLRTDTWDSYQDFHKNHGDGLFLAHVNACKYYTSIHSNNRMQDYLDFHKNRGHSLFLTHESAVNNYYSLIYSSKRGRDLLLPTVEDLQCRINELNLLEARIQEYTQVEIHGQTYQLSDILEKYERNYPCAYDTRHESYMLPQQQIKSLQKSFGPKPEVIYHLSYFDVYPSILFDDITHYSSPNHRGKERHTISTIDHALSRIKQALGSEMTYGGVVYALKLLHTTELLNTELTTLLSNEWLQLTSLDVTHFRAVKLLYAISLPLQAFIKTCVQYKFQIVDSDATFKSLETEVRTFYATELNNRRTCLLFFNRLYDILCYQPPNDTNNIENKKYLAVSDNSHISLLHKIKELKKVMAVLEPLSFVSHGPKLWQYFREMGWFEHDTKFDQDYHSLSTALANYDAVQEALIVEPLGPVVRFFITVQKLEKIQSIKLLLFKARTEHEVHAIKQATPKIQEDIHKLNSRLHSIKDLFQNVYYNVPTEINTSGPGPGTSKPSYQGSPIYLPFIESKQFDGPMVGYVFRRGDDGIGYYLDKTTGNK